MMSLIQSEGEHNLKLQNKYTHYFTLRCIVLYHIIWHRIIYGIIFYDIVLYHIILYHKITVCIRFSCIMAHIHETANI